MLYLPRSSQMLLSELLPEAKPHERAVLIVYSMGYLDAGSIARVLNYETNNTPYIVLRKFREFLPGLRQTVSRRIVHAGKLHEILERS